MLLQSRIEQMQPVLNLLNVIFVDGAQCEMVSWSATFAMISYAARRAADQKLSYTGIRIGSSIESAA